jgi:hypothetical protein
MGHLACLMNADQSPVQIYICLVLATFSDSKRAGLGEKGASRIRYVSTQKRQ